MTTWADARKAIRNRLHGVKIPATWNVAYSGEANGPFQVGEALTFQSGGTGTLAELIDAGSTGTMYVRMTLGATPPALGNTIMGVASGASAVVAAAPSGTKEETLTAFTYGPGGRQGPVVFPYCWILPPEIEIGRGPTNWRTGTVDAVVRVAIAPIGRADDTNELQRRYDEWWQALTVRWDKFSQLGDEADISVVQRFGGLASYGDVDSYWGFDMTLAELRVSEYAEFAS